MECGVKSVECVVWSVTCEVWSVECGVWSEVEYAVLSVKCEVQCSCSSGKYFVQGLWNKVVMGSDLCNLCSTK